MKALATTALKVYGVMQFYIALEIFAQFLPPILAGLGPGYLKWILGDITLLAVVAMVAFSAWVLTFRTCWIVDRLQIPAESWDGAASPQLLLKIGLVLVGVSAMISALETVVQITYSVMAQQTILYREWTSWGRFAGALAKIVFGGVLVGKSGKIAERIFPGTDGGRGESMI